MSIYRQYMYSYPHKTAYREIDRMMVIDYIKGLKHKKTGIYIHIPFCRVKCGFCNLFSIAETDEVFFEKYISAVMEQIEQYSGIVSFKDIKFDSVTIGGGTPSIIPPDLLRKLFSFIENKAGINIKDINSSVELSPSCKNGQMLDFIREMHFKRVSIGVQSFYKEELKAIGRDSNIEMLRCSLEQIKTYDFDNFNIDLIYGIPGQTEDSLKNSIFSALEYSPTEIFIYPLYARKNTMLEGLKVDENTVKNFYFTARKILLEKGFIQTSMRRFIKSERNVSSESCGFENNISFGCGGRTYIENLHFCEPYSSEKSKCRNIIDDFVNKKDFTEGLAGYILNEQERKRRYIIKNLFYVRGFEAKEYESLFGTKAECDFDFICGLKDDGMIKINEGRYVLTEEGMSKSDEIGPLFISPRTGKLTEEFHK